MHGRPEKWLLANLAQHAPAEPGPTGKLTGVCVQPPQQHVPSPTSWPQQNFIFFPSSHVSLKMSQGFLTCRRQCVPTKVVDTEVLLVHLA